MTSEPIHNSQLQAFCLAIQEQQGTVHGWKMVNPSDWIVDFSVPQQPELLPTESYENRRTMGQ